MKKKRNTLRKENPLAYYVNHFLTNLLSCHWQEDKAKDYISYVHANVCVGTPRVSTFLALQIGCS
jgi:hypothetical protein